MIVVTGATGNVGRLVVDNLAAAGHAVTAVSRGSSGPLPSRPGVTPALADLADVASITDALAGASALFVLVSGAGGHVDGQALLAAASRAGVRRVVLQSSQAVATRPGSIAYAPLAALEDAVRNSGLAWTVLRPGGFATNAFAWIQTIKEKHAVFAPFVDIALPAVDPADIAEVAAAALTDPAHAGATYTLTGPAATTPRQRVAALGEALGHPLQLVQLSPEQAHSKLSEQMPESVVESTLEILGQPTAEEQRISPDVEAVLRRPGSTFASWARRNVGAFR